MPPNVEPWALDAPLLVELAAADDRRQRQAVADRLGEADHVGHDPRVLEAPHHAGPAVAALDFVGDVEDAVLVADRAKLAQERGRGIVEATLALDGLDEDSRDAVRRDLLREDPAKAGQRAVDRGLLVTPEVAIDVRERRDVDRRQQRLVAVPVVDVRGGDADRAVRPAVEPAAERDQARAAADAARELERGFDRLGAGVREEDRVERRGHLLRDHLGQPADGLQVAERVADVEELVDLRVHRGRHGRVVMAERRRGDATGEVEVPTARRVDQLVTLAALPRTLVIAAEDRREVRPGECREVFDGRDRGLDGGIHRPSIGNEAPRMQPRTFDAGSPARHRRPTSPVSELPA